MIKEILLGGIATFRFVQEHLLPLIESCQSYKFEIYHPGKEAEEFIGAMLQIPAILQSESVHFGFYNTWYCNVNLPIESIMNWLFQYASSAKSRESQFAIRNLSVLIRGGCCENTMELINLLKKVSPDLNSRQIED